MEILYGNNKLRKQLGNASQIKKAFGIHARRVSARLEDIASAPNLKVLMQLPAACCHMLAGNRQGQWAVSISANQRLIFEIANSPVPLKEDGGIDAEKVTKIEIVEVVDYH